MSTPEERAKKRAEEWVGLLWHVAAYVIIVPFLFLLDWFTSKSIDWAYWAAIPWAVGLIFHIVAYIIGERFVERAYVKFLEEEKSKAKAAPKGKGDAKGQAKAAPKGKAKK